MYAPAVIEAIVTVITTLFIVPVTVYMYSAQTGFYEILAGHLIKETEPAPVAPEAVPVMVDVEKSAADVEYEEVSSDNDDLPKEV